MLVRIVMIKNGWLPLYRVKYLSRPKISSRYCCHPSSCASIRKLGRLSVKEVETELYTSWVDGKFYFKGYRFEDIAKKMERWYDVVIVYQNEEIKDMKFRGVIDKHVPLKQTH